MKKETLPPQSFWFKINGGGGYGHAQWLKSRRVFALHYLTAWGPVRGSEFKPDDPALKHVRRLKNRPRVRQTIS